MAGLSGVEIVPLEKGDCEAVAEFLLEHYYDETIVKALNFPRDAGRDVFPQVVDGSLASGVAVVAKDASTGAMVGCRLGVVTTDLDGIYAPMDVQSQPNEPMRLSARYFNRLRDHFALPIDCTKLLRFQMLCVHRDYRRRGIAGEMTRQVLEKGRKAGCDGALVTANTIGTQHIFRKLGFTPLRSLPFADVLDENGKQIIVTDDGTEMTVIYYLSL